MAHCLEEISSHKSSTDSERVLSNNEWEKLQETHQQVNIILNFHFMRMRHRPDLEKVFPPHVIYIYKKDSSMDLGPPYNTA